MQPHKSTAWLKSVPWNQTMRHVYDFETQSAQREYMTMLGALKIEVPLYVVRLEQTVVKVQVILEECLKYNYFCVDQSGKMYYFFVLGVDYVSENVTALTIQMDYYNTFMFDYQINNSFIERTHLNRVKIDSANPEVLRYNWFRNEPESIEAGAEYTYKRTEVWPHKPIMYMWVVTTGDWDGNPSGEIIYSKYGTVTPLFLGVVPFHPDHMEEDGFIQIREGTNPTTVIKISSPVTWLKNLVKNGGNVVQVFITKYSPIQGYYSGGSDYWEWHINGSIGNFEDVKTFYTGGVGSQNAVFGLNLSKENIYHTAGTMENPIWEQAGLSNKWFVDDPAMNKIDPKIKMYPFSKILVEMNRENYFEVRPELCPEVALTANLSIQYYVSIGEMFKEGYSIPGYADNSSLIPRMRVSSATQEYPLKTSAYAEYMRQNYNSMRATLANTQQSALVGSVSSAASNVAGGAFNFGLQTRFGSPALGIAGALGNAVQGLSAFAQASTEIENVIRSQSALKEDLKNTPDGLKLPGNNFNFEYVTDGLGINYYNATLTEKWKDYVADYFTKWGYAWNQIDTVNTTSRKYWNFIKTAGANISGNIPKIAIDSIASMYDAGVTIWHYSEGSEMYNYNHHNYERRLTL